MKRFYPLYTLCMVAVVVWAGCQGKTSREAVREEIPAVEVPRFDADSAYAYVAHQVSFGYRVPGTEAHRAAAEWLAAKLQACGATVTRQEALLTAWDGTRLPSCNIIGSFAPEKATRVLLLAHWDSRPYADYDPDPDFRRHPIEGANDGASGVGVLLEIARHLADNPPQVGVDILLLDAEDYGAPREEADDGSSWALGSQYWAEHPHKPGYRARFAILLDMVGAKGATFYREQFSQYWAPAVLDKVWAAAARLGYDYLFIDEAGGGVTDDHLYINRYGIPTIDIIHQEPQSPTGFFPYWHTRGDNMEHIDKTVLEAVGRTVMTVVYEEKIQ